MLWKKNLETKVNGQWSLGYPQRSRNNKEVKDGYISEPAQGNPALICSFSLKHL